MERRLSFRSAVTASLATMLLLAGSACGAWFARAGGEPEPVGETGGTSPASAVRPVRLTGVENAYQLTSDIYSGSQPEGDAAFAALAGAGVRTVLSVDGARPEVEAARRHGLRYVHLPIGYDGVPDAVALRLARVMRELPGPVYVHCHHGKHRGPTAAALLCEWSAGWSPEQAVAWLRQAGTSSEYPGLYRSVERTSAAASPSAPDAAPLPEVTPPTGLVETMVALDRRLDELQRCRQAGWRAPTDHPDLAPLAVATLAHELLGELGRTDETRSRPAGYRGLLARSEEAARDLHEALREAAALNPRANTALEALAASCKACHREYRR